jgi:formylglycine-generating enzyme required for sulfatase activity
MTVIEYLDFEIEIGLGQGRDYPLAVIRSPGGEARERMLFPFDELALASCLKGLQIALLRSGGQRRQTLSPQERTVQEFGQKLFDALLSGEIRSRYDVSQREAARRGLGMRIKLRIQAPELASLPWEFLYDPRRAEYICLSTQTSLVRYIELPQVIQPLLVAPPLRILGLIASPLGLAVLETGNEKERVETALADLVSSGQVQIDWLEHANRRELQRILRRGPWHILHFIGHGGFDPASAEGFIALETERGELDRLPATQLARRLADHASLRLAVLNSCEGTQSGNTDIFSSTASLLVRRGLPAVLAMQYEITDRAAIEFARGFYEALADDLPVDVATAEARKSVSLGLSNTIEWGTPVLHMRAPDGVLFEHLSPDELARQAAEREQAERESAEKAAREQAQRLAAAKASQPGLAPDKRQATQPRPITVELLARVVPHKQITPAWLRLTSVILLGFVICGLSIWGLSTLPVIPETSAPIPQVYNPHPAYDDIFDAQGVPMRAIPAGNFQMGSDQGEMDEKPVHKVSLDAYAVDKYEVTNALYQACQNASVCSPPGAADLFTRSSYYGDPEFDHYPVIYVDWNQAKTYCEWRGARLPTEAEWEYAARGGLEGKNYPWGDEAPVCTPDVKNGANFYACSDDTLTLPIGTFSPNGYGLYDMAGNVWEWVNDRYIGKYSATVGSEAFNPLGPAQGELHVSRGGSWYLGPSNLRVSYRQWYFPVNRLSGLGFRCVR